ncbi:alpha-L-rhamnosidase [Paenibacillus hemerocallicola]|uniref:alpha-L-rhamnosidase n=1 Tax=Paenibacillus hemerocallicola TaxID=1172614 RepID=A0A5C4SZ94_9BACL|nr:family 78 glycoside hydrolase catalytic domain [Paenibacillus hemerocallicola]TNJ62101.1 alpha-L-rhamnosidase [Paenibacillus hemerocallicola]
MFQIIDLRVNGTAEPMSANPGDIVFSWRLLGEGRAKEWTAYQVQLFDKESPVHEGARTVWDSGKVELQETYATYSGPALESASLYWWRVRVWDREQMSESVPARFGTGLLTHEWQSEWIWSHPEVVCNDFAYFRKELNIRGSIRTARLFVSAHNSANFYLNGGKVGGYVTPAPTNPWRRKYYTAYDVTSLLAAGPNCIAAVAHYLGGSGQNYVNGVPGFRLQLHVVCTDGATDVFKTDTTWETIRDAPHRIGTPYQQNRRISAIEDFDAGKLDHGWMRVGFESDKCEKAVPADSRIGDWPMVGQELPEGEIEELIVPAELYCDAVSGEAQKPGSERQTVRQVFDAGKIVSGWPRLRLAGTVGATVQLRYAEQLDEQGFVKHNVCNEKSDHYYDRYTVGVEEPQVWQPDLSYKAFRYVEATHHTDRLVPGADLWIASAHTAMREHGSFRCSNELLNEMAEACIQTLKNNTLGQATDCPHREQAQYLADVDLQAETLLYNFDARPILTKTLVDFADGQLEDGSFPYVYPTNFDNPAFNKQIPEWDLHYCTLLWKTYYTYGDIRIIAACFETAKRMVDHYWAGLDEKTGLVPADRPWQISDWPYSTVQQTAPFLTVQNIKLVQATEAMADMALVLGKPIEAQSYERMAGKLRVSIVEALFDRETGLFRDGFQSPNYHQGVNGLAVYARLVPEEAVSSALETIAEMKWESRTVLSLPLLRALFEGGKQEKAYRMIASPDYPGWGYMIRSGAKTMWEGWDDINSHCHAWNSYPLRLLQEYVAGIRQRSPGFRDVELRPYMPDDLTFAEATVTTVYGELFIRWERQCRDKVQLRIHVSIPIGMAGRLIIEPGFGAQALRIEESGEVIRVCGNSCEGIEGVTSCAWNGDTVELGLKSGRYDFAFLRESYE